MLWVECLVVSLTSGVFVDIFEPSLSSVAMPTDATASTEADSNWREVRGKYKKTSMLKLWQHWVACGGDVRSHSF